VNHQIIGARSYAATQFRPQFFRDVVRIGAVADDLGTDEDNQFGAGSLLVLMREAVTQSRDFIEQRNSVACSVLLLTDQSREQDRLSGRH
jgi:hypothetical protein